MATEKTEAMLEAERIKRFENRMKEMGYAQSFSDPPLPSPDDPRLKTSRSKVERWERAQAAKKVERSEVGVSPRVGFLNLAEKSHDLTPIRTEGSKDHLWLFSLAWKKGDTKATIYVGESPIMEVLNPAPKELVRQLELLKSKLLGSVRASWETLDGDPENRLGDWGLIIDGDSIKRAAKKLGGAHYPLVMLAVLREGLRGFENFSIYSSPPAFGQQAKAFDIPRSNRHSDRVAFALVVDEGIAPKGWEHATPNTKHKYQRKPGENHPTDSFDFTPTWEVEEGGKWEQPLDGFHGYSLLRRGRVSGRSA